MTAETNNLTLAQYYAAHAPAEVPDWFESTSSKKPNLRLPSPPEHLRVHCDQWRNDGSFDLVPSSDEQVDADYTSEDIIFLHEYERVYKRYQDDILNWELQDKENRYFQWRAYYGIEMARHMENL